VVLAISHTLRAQKALSRPDALPGFFEVVHRLLEDGVFVGHDRSIRTGGSLRSLFCSLSQASTPTGLSYGRGVDEGALRLSVAYSAYLEKSLVSIKRCCNTITSSPLYSLLLLFPQARVDHRRLLVRVAQKRLWP
jgi:hypothetical protein